MKSMFPGYYAPTDDELAELWKEATFVFDSSVLLQFYRLPEQTRNQAFKILEDLKERIWIPHHVALEYHRGRVRSIIEARDQVAKSIEPIKHAFDQVYRAVGAVKLEDRGLTDAVEKMEKIREAGDAVITAAEGALAGHIDPNGIDPVGERISELFDGAIGPAPDQEQIKRLEVDAAARYAVKMGPGFKDDGKQSFRFGDLTYDRRYSDYLVWSQTIDHVLASNIKHLIVVTNDAKDDWWLKHNNVVWGPLQEMSSEMLQKAELDRFWMYSFESFLASAKERLSAEVSTTTLSDVAVLATDEPRMMDKRSAINLGFSDFFGRSALEELGGVDRLSRTLRKHSFKVLESNGHSVIGFRDGKGGATVGAMATYSMDFVVGSWASIEALLQRLIASVPADEAHLFVYVRGALGQVSLEQVATLAEAILSGGSYAFREFFIHVGNDEGLEWRTTRIR